MIAVAHDWPLAPWMQTIGWETADLTTLNRSLDAAGDRPIADDADLAQAQIEADLERALALACAPARPERRFSHCHDCSEPLEPHRQTSGLCVPCKAAREVRDRQWATGA